MNEEANVKGVFISYRRVDAAGHAGRLFDRLAAHFGKDAVFMDVEGIEAGVDFVEVIEQAVGGCAALLAVIGRSWLTCVDEQGRRRLDDPQDFIRLEIGSALARKVRVVPVLVEGALMPQLESLPEDMRPLARRQSVELRDSRWDSDVEALIAVLERILALEHPYVQADAPARQARPARIGKEEDRRKHGVWLGGALALVAAVSAALYLLRPAATQPHVQEPVVSSEPILAAPPVPQDRTATGQAAPPAGETPGPERAAPPAEASKRKETPAVTPHVVPMAKPALALTTPPKTIPPNALHVQPKVGSGPAPVAADTVPRLPEASNPPSPVTPTPDTPPSTGSGTPTVMNRPLDPPPQTIAILARGEPSRRVFWKGESVQTYSAKMATLYGDTLQDVVKAGITIKVRTGGEGIPALLEGAPAARRQACESTGAAVVYVAQAQEGFSNSRTESAYWPELRLGAFPCDRDRLHVNRYSLSPRHGDAFPFAKDMGDAMLGFVRDNRHLLP
ncbi:MAG: TIR domain-containing protein [Thiobacillaceae bacterium]